MEQFPWSTSSAYPPRAGNAFDVYVDGQEAFAAIAHAVAQARTFVYATFAYVDLDCRFLPDQPLSLRALLLERATAGVDVRVLIWDPFETIVGTIPDPGQKTIPGLNEGPHSIQARWDRPGWGGLRWLGCHHQKSFMVDGHVAFIGGLNSTQPYWDTSDHAPTDLRRVPFSVSREDAAKTISSYLPLHDLFSKLQGPCVQDVEANFVERWNGATYKHDTAEATAHSAPGAAGALTMQVTRTLPYRQYASQPDGERSILESYKKAIHAARRFIYFENQYFYDHGISEALERALDRGVDVIGLMARKPDAGQLQGVLERAKEQLGNWNLMLRRLLRQSRVELYCPMIATPDPAAPGKFIFEDIYVHAKVMIIDDEYVTLGSANISTFSMRFHSEMNVALQDAPIASALRRRLWNEHFSPAKADDRLFTDLRHGFNTWRAMAAQNALAYKNKTQPLSRILPWDTR